ncbi:MAG: hypothetical protein HZB26_05320 [Candidatus Hydrogenedentes bacterium]|nr:hypothetical protein [Candidatus Hydrogenedentota bacterium]
MKSYLTIARARLTRHHVTGLFALAAACALLFTGQVESAEPANGADTAAGAPGAKGGAVAGSSSGPTVLLSFREEVFVKNPISSFMYFVPLISPTSVDRQTSANNDVEVAVISYGQKIGAKSFRVACEFETRGRGFQKYIFNSAGMIAAHTADLKENEPLTTTLDFINFEGEGFIRIEVEGTINDSTETVMEVNLQFNARGRRSPVTIGLYDIKPKDGKYEYENRTNECVARVNTLAFKKCDTTPRMGVSVASITTAAASEGFVARFKGLIANLLIRPPKIAELGNETMLDFGYAILKQKPEFTFPKAKNITEDRTVTIPARNS